jgi:hypothetical protein
MALLSVLGLSGCSDLLGQAQGELGRMQSLAAGCPSSPLLAQVDKDVSGSQDDPVIQEATFAAIRSLIEQAVACAAQLGRGHLGVRLFATNASQTATLLDEDLVVDGATDIARLRRVVRDQVADRLYEQVAAIYPDALADLPRSASDVTSRFALAGEAKEQLEQGTGIGWSLSLVVLTDGFASQPEALAKVKTVAEAEALAEDTRQAAPVGLSEAWRVALIGVGRTAGEKQPSTARIEAVKAFWRAYLEGTAEQVVVATDVPGSLSASATSQGR